MGNKQAQTDLPVPLARLDLYNEAIIMTKFENRASSSYPVSVHDLAAAFGTLPSSSGLLPRNTLFHGRNQGQEFVGIYISAKTHVVTVNETTLTIPLPPAVFIGCGKRYSIYAAKEYPKKGGQLYNYPSPNVGGDGRICAGDTPFPTCSPRTIMSAFTLFVESRFNGHYTSQKCKSFPGNVIELWKTISGRDEFPLSELVLSSASLRSWI